MACTIQVAVRVRPPAAADTSSITVDSSGVTIAGSSQHTYASDIVTGSDQRACFDAVAARLLRKLTDGFSCTLLAYGQTGSGKTHTMFGPPGCLTEASLDGLAAGACAPAWGVLPRAAMALLSGLPANAKMHASAIEVYQELAYDLLNDRSPLVVGTKGGNQLGGNEGVAVAGHIGSKAEAVGGTHPAGCRCRKCVAVKEAKAEEMKRRMAERRGESYFTGSGSDPMKMAKEARAREKAAKAKEAAPPPKTNDALNDFATVGETLAPLSTPLEVMRFCRTVELSRTTIGHALNARSSRSHCLVTLHVAQRDGPTLTTKKLLIVDLAGSERITKSGVEGVARWQAVAINTSLTALARVIEALHAAGRHVPYRDSTLTMLLRASLAGRSSTSVVIHVADAPEHAEESLCSLAFGARLAGVRNVATRVTSQSIGSGQLEAALARARGELVALEVAGKGPRFGATAEPGMVRAFEESSRRLEQLEGDIRSEQVAAQEAGGGGGSGERLATLRSQAQQLRQNLANSKSAVDRLTHEKFFHEASPAYAKKAREVQELIAQMQLAQ